MPASIIVPKNRIAKQIMIPVGATLRTPSIIILPNLASWNPSASATTIGIRTNAFMADMRFDMIRYMNTIIIENPAYASMVGLIVLTSSLFDHQRIIFRWQSRHRSRGPSYRPERFPPTAALIYEHKPFNYPSLQFIIFNEHSLIVARRTKNVHTPPSANSMFRH